MHVCLSCASTFDAIGWTCPRCGFEPSVVDGLPMFAPALASGNPEDADYGYDALFAAEGAHFWFTSRSRLIAWAVRHYFPGARSFFDVGCGTGGVINAVQVALPHLRLPFDREFDVIGVFAVLEHLDDDERALREMHRSTASGGGLIVTVPQHPFLWSALDEYSHHRRRYVRRDLVAKVRRAGYTVVLATSFMTLTLPAQFLARFRKQQLATLDPAAEMRLNPFVNGVLRALCDLERAALVRGLSFPMGGSLLLVARRTI